MKTTVYDCSIIELLRIENRAGNITSVHNRLNLPFTIKRVFYSYDIPGGEVRGTHTHKECHQFLVAASGAFEVVLDDRVNKRTIFLDRPFYGLHIPLGIWAAAQVFFSGSICLILALQGYEAEDYIRDYQEYLNCINKYNLLKINQLGGVKFGIRTDFRKSSTRKEAA